MKKITIIFFILILIIITSIYTIFNIYIRLENKKEKKEDINSKEKITSTDLRIGITNFDNINPILSENINVQNISRLIFEPLINLSYDYRLEECLATEWNKIDKNQYLIKLRENVKWQDDKKFNSDDVIFTINMLKELKEKSIYYYNVKDIESIKKIDEYTIVITTKKEISYFEYNLIFPIMSSKYFSEKNFMQANENLNPIGTGMYYIEDNNPNNIVLKKNNEWWNNKELKIENITINLYNNINEEISDIGSNKIDLITSSTIDIDKYIDDTRNNIKKYVGRNYNYLVFNCNNYILEDKNIRQAINYGINKEEIIKNVFQDKYIKSEFPLDFGCYLYNKNSERTSYDKSKADKILKENKIRNINLKLLVNKDKDNEVKVANLIKEQLEDIGIEININERSEKQYKDDLKKSNFDIAILENIYSFSPNLSLYFGEDNISNYKNESIIDLLRNMERNIEEKSRKDIETIREYYNKDVPFISLYYNTNTLIYTKNLKGEYTPNAYNIFYNIENWYREYNK